MQMRAFVLISPILQLLVLGFLLALRLAYPAALARLRGAPGVLLAALVF
jgi:hypothetical protein